MPAVTTDHAGSTVVVTGGAGFIGSHVVDMARAEGSEVVVIDDLSSGSPDNVPSDVRLEVLDITDRPALDRAIDAAKPSLIYHLAAQASVTRSVEDPQRDCEVNVVGTLGVLEAAARHGVQVIFTSTGGAIYGNDAPLPTNEDSPPVPISPYGASKWAAEAYVNTWREAKGVPHAVCRLANVYGPRQRAHGEAGVVAIFSYLLWSGQSPILFGFGEPTRDYVHVEDVARALRAAVGRAGTFNVSTGIETDVRTLFELMREIAGSTVEPELAPLRPGELTRSLMDPSRAREALGWEPQITLKAGLERTYASLVDEFERSEAPQDTVL
jgi:UDP-glucose 4-epimerase